MSLGLVKKIFFSALSLDTRLAREMPAGPSVGVFHEDQRSKYSETAAYGSTENYVRWCGVFGAKVPTATCIPRRSPIQVLTGLNLA